MTTQLLIPAKHQYEIPEWLETIPERDFPSGPKKLYRYLLVFGNTGCWQYNCRLAERFGVTERAIQKWLAWLKRQELITIQQPFNRRRRIWAKLYGERIEWFTSQCFAKASKKLAKAFMGKQAFEAEKDRQLRLLFGSGAKVRQLKSDPFPIKDTLPNLTEVLNPPPGECG